MLEQECQVEINVMKLIQPGDRIQNNQWESIIAGFSNMQHDFNGILNNEEETAI